MSLIDRLRSVDLDQLLQRLCFGSSIYGMLDGLVAGGMGLPVKGGPAMASLTFFVWVFYVAMREPPGSRNLIVPIARAVLDGARFGALAPICLWLMPLLGLLVSLAVMGQAGMLLEAQVWTHICEGFGRHIGSGILTWALGWIGCRLMGGNTP